MQINKTKPLTIAIASGGTGGHIWPSFTLMEYWQRQNPDIKIIWISTHQPHQRKEDTLSFRLSQKLGCSYMSFQSYAFRSTSLWAKFRLIGRLISHLLKIKKILKTHSVDWVIGFGSYASFASVLAGKWSGCFTAIQEQNAKAGLANRILLRWVDIGFEGFENALKPLKNKGNIYFSGNPLRQVEPNSTAKPPQISVLDKSHLSKKQMRVLIMGGSQGALFLNQTIPSLLIDLIQKHLKWHWCVIHQSGERGFQQTELQYQTLLSSLNPSLDKNTLSIKTTPFIDNIPKTLEGIDWVIARSGAMSVGELMQFQKPSLLIPYPLASDNHQYANACLMKKQSPSGAVWVIEQDNFTTLSFEKAATHIMQNLHSFKASDWQKPPHSCQKMIEVIENWST